MSKKLTFFALFLLAVFIISNVTLDGAGKNARRPAIVAGADNVCTLQRTDSDWEGTWYWYVGSTFNATNLTGVTALGLLEAFRDVKDQAYMDAAENAADFIMTHLGVGATGTQHHARTTAPDIVFLHRMSEVTANSEYAIRATTEWNNIRATYPTAGDLDTLFRAISRPSAWDIAFFLEAAFLSEDTTWANDAAAILADIDDDFYYGNTGWYALNIAGAVRALVGCGYYSQYPDDVIVLLTELIGLVDDDNGVDGWVQDSAYAVLALNTVGGAARAYANSLGRWLARQQQEDNGGWIELGDEYPEVNGEAVRALSSTIGANISLDGFEQGLVVKSSWRKLINNAKSAEPFNGN